MYVTYGRSSLWFLNRAFTICSIFPLLYMPKMLKQTIIYNILILPYYIPHLFPSSGFILTANLTKVRYM